MSADLQPYISLLNLEILHFCQIFLFAVDVLQHKIDSYLCRTMFYKTYIPRSLDTWHCIMLLEFD